MVQERDQAIGGGLLAAASIGFSVFVPLAYPNLDSRIARAILVCSVVAAGVGVIIVWRALRAPRTDNARPVARRWAVVGFGQGWIEVRVRNNDGDAFVISANPGGSADQIAFDLIFVGERRPKRSELVEVIFEVDNEPFELDIPDAGAKSFSFRTVVWRDLEYLRRIVAALRRGKLLRVTVPSVALSAEFTLDGAYEVLEEVEELGVSAEGPAYDVND